MNYPSIEASLTSLTFVVGFLKRILTVCGGGKRRKDGVWGYEDLLPLWSLPLPQAPTPSPLSHVPCK